MRQASAGTSCGVGFASAKSDAAFCMTCGSRFGLVSMTSPSAAAGVMGMPLVGAWLLAVSDRILCGRIAGLLIFVDAYQGRH